MNIMIADAPVDFARSIVRLLSDSALRNALGGAGRRLVVDRYQWRDVALQFGRVYQQAVAAGPRARAASR